METNQLIKQFTSPINRDDGSEHWFVGHARSTMRLVYHDEHDDADARIVWEYTFLDGTHKGETELKIIVLWLNKNRLVAFDGVHELPDEAIELLETNGIDATYARS